MEGFVGFMGLAMCAYNTAYRLQVNGVACIGQRIKFNW